MRNQAANALVALAAFATPDAKADPKLTAALKAAEAKAKAKAKAENEVAAREPEPHRITEPAGEPSESSREGSSCCEDPAERRQSSPACSVDGPHSASEQASCAGGATPKEEDGWESEEASSAGSVHSLLNATEYDTQKPRGDLSMLLCATLENAVEEQRKGEVVETESVCAWKRDPQQAEELALIALASLSAMAEDVLKAPCPSQLNNGIEQLHSACFRATQPNCPSSQASTAPSTPPAPAGEGAESVVAQAVCA